MKAFFVTLSPPFTRQALHSLRCSRSPLCTCSSLSFSFLSLSDWDGTEQSRGGFASSHASEDHIFSLLLFSHHTHGSVIPCLFKYIHLFLPWWSLSDELLKCNRKVTFQSLTQSCLSQIRCLCISSYFCCSTRALLLSDTVWEPLWPFLATQLKGHQDISQIKNLSGGAWLWCWNKWTWLTDVGRVSWCF